MTERGDIRIFEDRAFQARMARASYAVIGVGIVAGALWFAAVAPALGCAEAEIGTVLSSRVHGIPAVVAWAAALVCGVLGSLILHEGVHGLLFKLLAPRGARVLFGADRSLGLIYASADGVTYPRRRYLAIILAPTVVVTALALAAAQLSGWPVLWYAVGVMHLSGCAGDWGYARIILRDPGIAWCEDTSWGVRFFARDAARGERP